MIGVRGADPYGLSVPLLDAGFEVRITTEWKRPFRLQGWKRRLERLFSREETELSMLGMKDNMKRALMRGLRVENKRPTVDELVQKLHEGFVPIALVHMGVVHKLDIPHWVVVTDVRDAAVTFNDPYPPKGRRGLFLSHAKFQKILDDIGTKIGLSPSVVYVKDRRTR